MFSQMKLVLFLWYSKTEASVYLDRVGSLWVNPFCLHCTKQEQNREVEKQKQITKKQNRTKPGLNHKRQSLKCRKLQFMTKHSASSSISSYMKQPPSILSFLYINLRHLYNTSLRHLRSVLVKLVRLKLCFYWQLSW